MEGSRVCFTFFNYFFYQAMVYHNTIFRYPNSSTYTYEKRLFYPLEEALRSPSWYKKEHIVVKKPELPDGVSDLKQYNGRRVLLSLETMVDWFDGLQTFMRYICHTSWLGGSLMPQKKKIYEIYMSQELVR
ncbi:hypothetical protein HanPI659440_Chr05g0206381 [Helianthus annuus]|nr:hypothetical protein HanPI659440_Chr05g0206381 [Helianthus annuus]